MELTHEDVRKLVSLVTIAESAARENGRKSREWRDECLKKDDKLRASDWQDSMDFYKERKIWAKEFLDKVFGDEDSE